MSRIGRCGVTLIGALLLAQLGGGARDPIGDAKARALRPVPQAPAQGAGTSVWVPPRRVFLPGTTEEVWVPGHYERVISPTQVWVPPLSVESSGGQGVTIPAGERPPAGVRPGP